MLKQYQTVSVPNQVMMVYRQFCCLPWKRQHTWPCSWFQKRAPTQYLFCHSWVFIQLLMIKWTKNQRLYGKVAESLKQWSLLTCQFSFIGSPMQNTAADRNLSAEDQALQQETGKFRPYALVAKSIPARSAASMCPPRQDKLPLLLLNLLTLTTELIERLDSIKRSRMNSVFKTNGPKQIKSALHLWLFSFSKIQEISAYPSDRADVKNHLLWTSKAQWSCHPFKINSQLFHCLQPYTDTDRVLAEANPAKDQLSYAVRIVWRPSWLLPHLKKENHSDWQQRSYTSHF